MTRDEKIKEFSKRQAEALALKMRNRTYAAKKRGAITHPPLGREYYGDGTYAPSVALDPLE